MASEAARRAKRAYKKTEKGMATEARYANSEKGRLARKKSYDKAYRLRPERREQMLNSALRKYYGIDVAEFNRMFDVQSGCCAICMRHQSEFKKRLSVDHDHSTGKVRALLCQHCNQGLGHFRDSANLLSLAMTYLSKHKKEN